MSNPTYQFYDDNDPKQAVFYLGQISSFFKNNIPNPTDEQSATMKKLIGSVINAKNHYDEKVKKHQDDYRKVYKANEELHKTITRLEDCNPTAVQLEKARDTIDELIAQNEHLQNEKEKNKEQIFLLETEISTSNSPPDHCEAGKLTSHSPEVFVIPEGPYTLKAHLDGMVWHFKRCVVDATDEDLRTLAELRCGIIAGLNLTLKSQKAKYDAVFSEKDEKIHELSRKMTAIYKMTESVTQKCDYLSAENNELQSTSEGWKKKYNGLEKKMKKNSDGSGNNKKH